ncbi:hypothetical protein [Streptomyces sp. PvR034]|uniref:hypothetical protein n=1 Tax=Streptomyces sp. PvR034 TaxID=3156401 RepID=UPI003393D338
MTTRIFENRRVRRLTQAEFLAAACLIAAQEAEHQQPVPRRHSRHEDARQGLRRRRRW